MTTNKNMVNVDTLVENVRINKYAAMLNDYRNSSDYISDIISEIADCNTSIYYSDILDFVRDNPVALADVVEEGFYSIDGNRKYNFYEHAQAAEFMTIEHAIYKDLENALLICAHDYIKYDCKRDTISNELAEKIYRNCENGNINRMNELINIIDYFMEGAENE